MEQLRIYRRCLATEYETYETHQLPTVQDLMARIQPDVLVLNTTPAGMDIIRRIRTREVDGAAYTGIIAITPSTLPEAIRDSLDAGADSFCNQELAGHQLLPLVTAVYRIHSTTASLKEMGARLRRTNADLEEANRELEQLCITDELTGLFNMRHINVRLDEEFLRATRYGHPLSVIMIDIDHFKQVNDNNDHLLGSYVIGQVGKDIGQVIRDVDIGGRYGGDEYIIILPETDEQGALALSRRLHTIIKRRTYNDGHNKIKITLSQGIGVMHGATTRLVSGKDLIRQADKALYEAKELGRDLIMVRNEKGTRKEPGNAS